MKDDQSCEFPLSFLTPEADLSLSQAGQDLQSYVEWFQTLVLKINPHLNKIQTSPTLIFNIFNRERSLMPFSSAEKSTQQLEQELTKLIQEISQLQVSPQAPLTETLAAIKNILSHYSEYKKTVWEEAENKLLEISKKKFDLCKSPSTSKKENASGEPTTLREVIQDACGRLQKRIDRNVRPNHQILVQDARSAQRKKRMLKNGYDLYRVTVKTLQLFVEELIKCSQLATSLSVIQQLTTSGQLSSLTVNMPESKGLPPITELTADIKNKIEDLQKKLNNLMPKQLSDKQLSIEKRITNNEENSVFFNNVSGEENLDPRSGRWIKRLLEDETVNQLIQALSSNQSEEDGYETERQTEEDWYEAEQKKLLEKLSICSELVGVLQANKPQYLHCYLDILNNPQNYDDHTITHHPLPHQIEIEKDFDQEAYLQELMLLYNCLLSFNTLEQTVYLLSEETKAQIKKLDILNKKIETKNSETPVSSIGTNTNNFFIVMPGYSKTQSTNAPPTSLQAPPLPHLS